MTLKAIFLPGQTRITVNGLHQWDYGQQLQIEAEVLPALIEVHFACVGMKEAVVRSCSATNGVATVAIPDICLEQSAPITAWIFEINGTTGTTTKSITLTVTSRARPAPITDAPESFTDSYTELIGAVNDQVESLKAGNVTVANAIKAQTADNAAKAAVATNAYNANHAGNADWAKTVSPQLIAAYDTGVTDVPIDKPGVYYLIYGKLSLSAGVIQYSSVIAIDDINVNTYGSAYINLFDGAVTSCMVPRYVNGSLSVTDGDGAKERIYKVYRIAWFAEAEE